MHQLAVPAMGAPDGGSASVAVVLWQCFKMVEECSAVFGSRWTLDYVQVLMLVLARRGEAGAT